MKGFQADLKQAIDSVLAAHGANGRVDDCDGLTMRKSSEGNFYLIYVRPMTKCGHLDCGSQRCAREAA